MGKANTLGKEAVLLTISKMATLVITTVTAMLLSRFRTYAEYGTYSQLALAITLFHSIFMLGLPNSINYFLAKANSQEEQQRFLGVYYTLSTILSGLMGVCLAAAAPLIAAYFENPLILSFGYFLLLYPWANVAGYGIENVLVAYHKTKMLTAYRIVNSLCLLGAVLVVQWLGLGFQEYMIAHLAVYCIFAIAVYCISYRISGGFRPCLDKKLIRTIFALSLPLGFSSVVATLNIEIDKLLIGFLTNTEQLAIYTNASKELPVSFVSVSISAVLMPRLTIMLKKDRNREAVNLWAHASVLAFLVICLIAAGVFTYAEDVMTLLYSEKYLPGLPVFRVYTLVLLLRCTYFGIILNAKGRTREILYAGLVSLVLNAVLNLPMYFLLGTLGPALATFVSLLVAPLWLLRRTARCTGMRYSQIFPWKRIGYITLVNLGFAILFYILKQLLPLEQWLASLGESVALGACWCAAYLFVMRRPIKHAWAGLNQESAEES